MQSAVSHSGTPVAAEGADSTITLGSGLPCSESGDAQVAQSEFLKYSRVNV